MRAVRSAAVILTAIVLLVASAPAVQPRQAAEPRSPLTSLGSVDDLRMSFNKDRGKLRLVLLLSPT